MRPHKNIFAQIGEQIGDKQLKGVKSVEITTPVNFVSDVNKHRENLSKLQKYFEISRKIG